MRNQDQKAQDLNNQLKSQRADKGCYQGMKTRHQGEEVEQVPPQVINLMTTISQPPNEGTDMRRRLEEDFLLINHVFKLMEDPQVHQL